MPSSSASSLKTESLFSTAITFVSTEPEARKAQQWSLGCFALQLLADSLHRQEKKNEEQRMCKDGGREWEGEGTVMDQDRHTCTCHLPAFLMQDPPFGYVVSQKIKQTQTQTITAACVAQRRKMEHIMLTLKRSLGAWCITGCLVLAASRKALKNASQDIEEIYIRILKLVFSKVLGVATAIWSDHKLNEA